MTGFIADSANFLGELAANNTREWFTDNRDRYETAIKLPAAAFAPALCAALETLTGQPHVARIFRIHRDVRFSADKTPYNAHLRMGFTPRSASATPPVWMFSLEPDRIVLGAGVFGYDGAALDRWRNRVAGPDGADLSEMLSDLTARGHRLSEPDLARVPRPFPSDHPRADLLRRKGLVVWMDCLDPSRVTGDSGVPFCLAGFERLRPVRDWLLAV